MGQALTRSGAKPGDWITYTAGTPGDSAAGLAILQNRLQVADAKDADCLIKRHLRPSPRILQGQALRDLANSAIDLSDGLISDLGHIVKASDCGARIDLALLPFSDALSRHVEQALRWALSGGEDYELCFYGAGTEPWRAGCGSRTPGRTVYLYRANDRRYPGAVLFVTANLSR